MMQKSLSFKNNTISFSDVGKGSAVVLLHGFLENSSMWSSIVPELSKTNRVITIDLLGHGQTECLGYVHSMEEMAESVEAVLKSLRIRRITFIGHSLGGYVALAFAEKFPLKVKGICLMNSTATADSEERKEFRDLALKVAKKSYKSVIRISVRNLFSERNQEELKDEVELVINEAQKTSLQSYVAAQEGMKLRPNRERVIKNATFKTLQITGEKDEIIWLDDVKQEAKRTQTELIILPGGHMSHIENKEELTDILKKFVRFI